MRLYYPPESLAALLDASQEALAEWLSQGDVPVDTPLGTLRLTAKPGREALRQLFSRFSPDSVCERMADGGDFQYVLYFPDGTVDPYYYCITDEMGHLTYHRFTRADYLALTE